MDTETGGGPAIGRSVWVIDDRAPERKVPGRIVSDATEGLFGEAEQHRRRGRTRARSYPSVREARYRVGLRV
jgi:hypothetical protein